MSAQFGAMLFSLLSTAGAGALFAGASSRANGEGRDFLPLSSFIIAAVFVSAAFAALILSIGHPENILRILGRLSSPVAKEYLTAAALLALSVFLVLKGASLPKAAYIVVAVLCAAAALTLNMRGAVPSRPALDTMAVPLSYACGGFITGAAAAGIFGGEEAYKRIIQAASVLLFAAAVFYGARLFLTGALRPERLNKLLEGGPAAYLRLCIAASGIIMPMLLITFFSKNPYAKAAAFIFAAAGALCFRTITWELGARAYEMTRTFG